MLAITKLIADRFTKDRMGRRPAKQACGIITLFPLQKDLSVSNFATMLQRALKKFGRTAIVDSRYFRKKRGNPEYAISDLLESLYHLQDKIWTETILHHTNRILLVTDGQKAEKLTPEEIRFLGDSEEAYGSLRELVLLYAEPGKRPANTATLTRIRKVDAVRHIRTYGSHGFDSLARFITGSSVGLALGGGGPKGLAHIGLLKAMHEENIPIDMIGGTSAGALMAGIYAMGYDAPEMERIIGKAQKQKDVPNLLSLLMRATFVASDAAVAQARAESDIFAELPVEQFGLFDWKKFYQLVDIGYRYGKNHAKSWKKQLGIRS